VDGGGAGSSGGGVVVVVVVVNAVVMVAMRFNESTHLIGIVFFPPVGK